MEPTTEAAEIATVRHVNSDVKRARTSRIARQDATDKADRLESFSDSP
jgi:hypothetical protein